MDRLSLALIVALSEISAQELVFTNLSFKRHLISRLNQFQPSVNRQYQYVPVF